MSIPAYEQVGALPPSGQQNLDAGAGAPLAVALSGGGAKCAAQAGVLQVLQSAGVAIDALAGVSAGGLVAVLYALGWAPEAISAFILETHLLDVWDFGPGRSGLLNHAKILARLTTAVGDRTFDDLALPVVVVAVDLETGQEVGLDCGRLDEALLATMALPGLIEPVCLAGRRLVDGAVLNPLPVDVARRLGRTVIGVDVIPGAVPQGRPQLFEAHGFLGYAAHVSQRLGLAGALEVVHQAVSIATGRLRDYRLQAYPPDLLISPAVDEVGLFAFDLAEHAFEQGQAAARQALPQILSWSPQPQDLAWAQPSSHTAS
jgi:NTE family protein